MMLRPRDSHDQRHLEAQLDITPEPARLRWSHDVFGNNVAYARFGGRAQELTFLSTLRLQHARQDPADIEACLEDYARVYPFSYDPDEMADLLRSVERHYPDPSHQLDHWARSFLRTDGPTDTPALLTTITHAIRARFTYVAREEMGVQDPIRTLRLGSGSCRDFAVLMIEAVRALGFAARFVSGYLYVPQRSTPGQPGRVGGGATHAWLQVYVPGAGWVEMDPTNGIVGNRDLIRVAVTRDHRHAVPLHGTWTGFPSASLGMTVEVSVTEAAPDAPAVP